MKGEPAALDADGLNPGVESDGVDRKPGEATLGVHAPDHPCGASICDRSRLASKSDKSVSGLGAGLFAAEMAGLGVAESRVDWIRGG